MVRHLDDPLRGGASELHVHVDGLHHLAEGERPGRASRSVRRRRRARPVRRSGRQARTRTSATTTTQTTRVLEQESTTGTPRSRTAAMTAARSARTTTTGSRPGPRSRDDAWHPAIDTVDGSRWRTSVSARRGRWAAGSPTSSTAVRGCRLGALLAGPVGWLVIRYLGSLVVLLIAAFWSVDALSGEIDPRAHPRQLQGAVRAARLSRVALRTIGIAAAATVTDALLAFPIAFYMAKIARPEGAGGPAWWRS